jgi:hypothetical protein
LLPFFPAPTLLAFLDFGDFVGAVDGLAEGFAEGFEEGVSDGELLGEGDTAPTCPMAKDAATTSIQKICIFLTTELELTDMVCRVAADQVAFVQGCETKQEERRSPTSS